MDVGAPLVSAQSAIGELPSLEEHLHYPHQLVANVAIGCFDGVLLLLSLGRAQLDKIFFGHWFYQMVIFLFYELFGFSLLHHLVHSVQDLNAAAHNLAI